jgi:battenin
VFCEGLLGGATYVNCFYQLTRDIPSWKREFSLAAVSMSDVMGITLAGLVSILLEPALCTYQHTQGRLSCQTN